MDYKILYGFTLMLVIISAFRDRAKTRLALKKAWQSFEKILPELLGILILMSLVLAFLEPELISKMLGKDSGWWGVLIATGVGAIAMIPGFVAFPIVAMLLQKGAGYAQMAAFLSSLMMVGIITLPLEVKYFGKKTTLLRNITAFMFALMIAWVMGRII